MEEIVRQIREKLVIRQEIIGRDSCELYTSDDVITTETINLLSGIAKKGYDVSVEVNYLFYDSESLEPEHSCILIIKIESNHVRI